MSEDSRVRYLIVGGGMAADAAARGIRSEDPEGSVLLLTRERHPPYDRPPLSKGLWKHGEEERIWRETASLGVEVRTDVSVTSVDPDSGEARDRDDRTYGFERLLLATGADPRRLRGPDPGVVYFRTLDDYRALHSQARLGSRIAVVGGGFIGCELAAALRERAAEVSLHFPEDAPLSLILPPPFPALLASAMEEAGVTLHGARPIHGTERLDDGHLRLIPEDGGGRDAPDDTYRSVVAGLGVEANTELARSAGLEVDDGIVVDGSLRTSHPAVWAAGDVASCWFPFLGRRLRVEHEEHANESGLLAGRAMTGAEVAYDALPYFYSDVFGIAIEALGRVDPTGDPELLVPQHPRAPGAAVLREPDGRVRGVVLWNRPGKAGRVRKVLARSPDAALADLQEALGL